MNPDHPRISQRGGTVQLLRDVEAKAMRLVRTHYLKKILAPRRPWGPPNHLVLEHTLNEPGNCADCGNSYHWPVRVEGCPK